MSGDGVVVSRGVGICAVVGLTSWIVSCVVCSCGVSWWWSCENWMVVVLCGVCVCVAGISTRVVYVAV